MEVKPTEGTIGNEGASSISHLGVLQHEFRPGIENVLAGIIIALVLILAGFAIVAYQISKVIAVDGDLPFVAERGLSWLFFGFICVVCTGAVVAGGFLMRYALGLRLRKTHVHEQGLSFVSKNAVESVPRSELAEIHEMVQFEHFPLKFPADKLIPMGKSRSYLIIRSDGWQTGVSGNAVRQIARFGRILKEQADLRGIVWKIIETEN